MTQGTKNQEQGPDAPQAGGLKAISRWLSEATPPDWIRETPRIPEGCQPWHFGTAWMAQSDG